MITFHTNDNEVVASTSPTGVNSEETTTPQGIIGFSLDYKQISCWEILKYNLVSFLHFVITK